MPKNKTFCIKPFTATCIRTDGRITLCCKSIEQTHYNLKTSTITEWWNSNFLKEVRTQLLNGQQPASCQICFDQEKSGVSSLRQAVNSDHKIFEQYAEKTLQYLGYPGDVPVDIEVQLTNLCNLKCLTCIETESSSILSENKILKIANASQTDYKVTKYEMEQLTKLLYTKPRLINLRGGEALLVPEIKTILTHAIENNLVNETIMHLTTNGTKFDDEWLRILSKFKDVRIQLSIDGIDKTAEYIRYGCNWNQIENNITKLKELSNVNLFIHATVSNLNLLSIGEVIQWCANYNHHFQFDTVMYPVEFSINNLPPALVSLARQRLSTVEHPAVNDLLALIDKIQSTYTSQWDKFRQEITMRDNHRNNNILDIIPEFKAYWHV